MSRGWTKCLACSDLLRLFVPAHALPLLCPQPPRQGLRFPVKCCSQLFDPVVNHRPLTLGQLVAGRIAAETVQRPGDGVVQAPVPTAQVSYPIATDLIDV